MSRILTSIEVQEFCSANQRAIMLIDRGTLDYVGARCCLLNHVFSGFELAAQSVEKHLKAMLVLRSPGLNVRGYTHKVIELAAAVQDAGIVDLSSHQQTIGRLHGHYQGRYPDNPGQLTSASTAEIVQIDLLLDRIVAAMPVLPDVAIRTGVYGRALLNIGLQLPFPETTWLLQSNVPLLTRFPSLVERYNQWKAFNYPGM